MTTNDIERRFIAGAIAFPHVLDGMADDLQSSEFDSVVLGGLWLAISGLMADGLDFDQSVVVDRARRTGELIDLATLNLDPDPVPPIRGHVEIIKREAATRSISRTLATSRSALSSADPYELAQITAADLDAIGHGASRGRAEAMTIPELLAMAGTRSPWVIPGLLRSDWRGIIVASEGLGKSTLLRQFAMLSAQGIHPLMFQPIPAIRVLIVDAENPLAAIAETGTALEQVLRVRLGDNYAPEQCRIWSRPGGLDVRLPRDRAELIREIRHFGPQLVVMGPVYKLGARRDGESYEEAAEGIQRVLDDLRTRFGFALLLEHHAPKPSKGQRDMLPFGSQRWMAWPELGLTMTETKRGTGVDLGRFRGDRLSNVWPDRLDRGATWPWEGVWDHGMPKMEDLK